MAQNRGTDPLFNNQIIVHQVLQAWPIGDHVFNDPAPERGYRIHGRGPGPGLKCIPAAVDCQFSRVIGITDGEHLFHHILNLMMGLKLQDKFDPRHQSLHIPVIRNHVKIHNGMIIHIRCL